MRRLINERVITLEHGILTQDILDPKMDAKGNWISGQMEFQNRIWDVRRSDQWEEDKRLWQQVQEPPPHPFQNAELTRPAGLQFLK